LEIILAGVEKAVHSTCGDGGRSQASDHENYKKLLETQRQHNESWEAITENFKE